jgi:hypothetical protein
MNEGYDIITRNGGLRLFKADPQWERERLVSVAAPGLATRTLRFPAGLDVLDVVDLPAWADVTVSVHHAHPLRRLVKRPVVLQARPKTRRLRGLITGSGRCGTQSVAHWLDGRTDLDGNVLSARHESLWHYLLPMIAAGRVEDVREIAAGFTHEIECAPHFSLLPAAIDAGAVVRLIRDGRRVVQSGLNRGWYVKEGPWNRVKPVFPGDAFAKSCRFWVHANRNLDRVATHTFRLEDLVASAATRAALLAVLGLPPGGRPLPASNAGQASSQADRWTPQEREVFEEICGELMDEHYPGWRREAATASEPDGRGELQAVGQG